jgi:DNA mismatch repair endonuclease MutH
MLAASRSGTGKGADDSVINHCKDNIPVSRRAFSLKPGFTRVIWNEIKSPKEKYYSSIQEKYAIKEVQDIEDILLEKVSKLSGLTLTEIQKKFSIEIPQGKSASSALVRAALGFPIRGKPIREIEQAGIVIKIIPVNTANDMPWESMSFPYQPLKEIALEETFEDSELYQLIQGLLIIPIYRLHKKRSNNNQVIGRPFVWRPDMEELNVIEEEWQKYRAIISTELKVEKKYFKQNGDEQQAEKLKKEYRVVTNLPKESQTNIIHIRPHARDSRDLDPTLPAGLQICKQSFWLNKKFLKALILKNK